MNGKTFDVVLNLTESIKIKKWKIKEGMLVSARQVIFIYDTASPKLNDKNLKFKCTRVGTVRKILALEEDIVNPGDVLLELEECNHPTVMKDMCAECGTDLRKSEVINTNASVPMVHSVPELKVSEELALIIGKADENRLLNDRKLVLLVDLDQTLIHTTNDNIPPNLKDVYHFRLYGQISPWYHTRIRPRTHHFLEEISKYYELHICTFGARNYAHMIAMFLDPDGKYFSHRILSRDECFNANSKTANLKALFPCGDNMVCIIDDREDVWNFAANLIHVKPYHFFKHTGDINAPPGLTKNENDEIDGFDFTNLDKSPKEEPQKFTDTSQHKKINILKSKVDTLGESTSDKDTEDEIEKKYVPKVGDEPKQEDIEKVTEDLRLSEDDSNDILVECKIVDKLVDSNVKKKCHASDIKFCKSSNKSSDSNVDDIADKNFSIFKKDCGNNKEKKFSSNQDSNVDDIRDNNIQKEEDNLIEIEDADDYLLYLEGILKNIHSAFYKKYELLKNKGSDCKIPDLKLVIPNVKKQVLKDCHLVFSGLVPSHVPLQQSRAYLVAVSLGAKVLPDISSGCTHLVAARPGTAKVNSSRRQKGITIVTPLWLWHCAERWKRVDERLYPLVRGGLTNRIPPPHCGSPDHNINTDIETYLPALKNRTPSGRFIDTINPLLTFSSEDMKIMDQEVDDLCKEDDDDDDDHDHDDNDHDNDDNKDDDDGDDDDGDDDDDDDDNDDDDDDDVDDHDNDNVCDHDHDPDVDYKKNHKNDGNHDVDDDDESESELVKRVLKINTPSKISEIDSSTTSSEDSLSGKCHPKGWSEKKSRKRKVDTTTCTETEYDEEFPSVKFRRGEPLPSDLDLGDESQDTPASDEAMGDADDGEWNMMGVALERQFLSGK